MSKAYKISFGVLTAAIALLLVTLFVFKVNVPKESELTGQSQQAAAGLAENWIKDESKTYSFDGFDLTLSNISTLTCQNCYQASFAFQSSHAGLGDRSEQILAQVITPHKIVVTVKDGAISSAITDEIYDELTGNYLVRE
ncbi:MAG: hypothetical protein AAB871_03535 [Patescibacteria group bacterium]